MSEALTSAAKALVASHVLRRHSTASVDVRAGIIANLYNDFSEAYHEDARAAILSFLDGEDVVEACARALAHEDWTGESAEFRATRLEVSAEKAQRAIAALRALVQEDGK